MKKIGIIAEFNPFHNGHKYLIERIKEKYPDSLIIVILSGNYTQRGEVSLIDKWKKTDICLEEGIDLVVELPFPFATQSADYFAKGSLEILNELKVDYLAFGSESDDIDTLKDIAKCQLNNKEFDLLVKMYCKTGLNYSTAMSHAIKDLINKKIDTPNDLLAISYLKEIIKNNYNIEPLIIKRTNNYHNNNLEDLPSAKSIRVALKDKKDIKKYVPKSTLSRLTNLHFIDDYYELLKYKIITDNDLNNYQTTNIKYINKLKKEVLNSNNVDELIKNIKSKNDTYNKISRMLLHILVGFTKEQANSFKNISYIRILGFNSKGKDYLNKIKKDIDIPIISKIKRDKDPMLEFEIYTTKIYNLTSNDDLYKLEFSNHPGGNNEKTNK